MRTKIPPSNDKTINIDTNIPPNIAVAIDNKITNTEGRLPLADIDAAANAIMTKDKNIPAPPNPVTMFPPSVSNAPPTPPINRCECHNNSYHRRYYRNNSSCCFHD